MGYRRLDDISQTGVVRNRPEVGLWLGGFWEQTRHRGVNYPGLSVFGFSKFLHVALCQFECTHIQEANVFFDDFPFVITSSLHHGWWLRLQGEG